MQKYDVVILTDSRYVNPASPNNYVQNILVEDGLVWKALEQNKLRVTRKDWADPEFDWASTKAVLFRTTWDYFDRYEKFKNWLTETSQKAAFINSLDIIRWNMDKKYLEDLEQNDVRIIPSLFIKKGNSKSLAELHNETGWTETVIKPTVGGGGRHTYHLNEESIAAKEELFKRLFSEEDFMLQPFQKSIPEKGEWSFIFFGDTFSHAVLKKAQEGDFRVQDDFGGTVHSYHPTPNEIDFALQALAACPFDPAYARVDIVQDNDEKPAVSEIELIEPELWFRRKPEAANLLADEVLKRL